MCDSTILLKIYFVTLFSKFVLKTAKANHFSKNYGMTSRNKVYFLMLKYLFYLNLTLLCALAAQNLYAQSSEQVRKVVIDAGHGGKDPGTMYKDVKEKDITLAVSLKLGKLIKQHHPSVEVFYTRNSDVFIELNQRGEIANKNHADLFISIHVNATKGSTTASGSETYVMGLDKTASNMAVAQRENSVITFEDDFSSKYEGFDPNSPESHIIFSLMQNVHLEQSLHLASFVQEEFGNAPIKVNRGVKQAGFLVLWKTAMPSILVELGFITNPTDRDIMVNDSYQDRLASSLLSAFTRYKNMCEKTGNASYSYSSPNLQAANDPVAANSTTDSSSIVTAQPNNDKGTVYYRVQIISINKNEPLSSKIFKGHKGVQSIKVGALYKYTLGNTTKKSEALALSKQVQKDFPGAFVIAVRDGKIIPMR